MKQDELNIEFKEFTEKLNLEEVVNIELESGFLLSFINHLLSKKPSVSDEEIKDWADYTYPDIDKETDVYLRRGFFAGFKKALSLPPQVVQSEVSEYITDWDLILKKAKLLFPYNDLDTDSRVNHQMQKRRKFLQGCEFVLNKEKKIALDEIKGNFL